MLSKSGLHNDHDKLLISHSALYSNKGSIIIRFIIPILFWASYLFCNSEKSQINALLSSATLHKWVGDSGAQAMAFTKSLWFFNLATGNKGYLFRTE